MRLLRTLCSTSNAASPAPPPPVGRGPGSRRNSSLDTLTRRVKVSNHGRSAGPRPPGHAPVTPPVPPAAGVLRGGY